MSKKYYDEFSKLTLNKMADKITDMTYEYENTEVPSKHFRKILQTEVIEMLAQDSAMEMLLLNAVLTQLTSLQKESPKLFFKAMLCLNEKINIEKMNTRTYDSIEKTYQDNIEEKQLINEKFSEEFKTNYEEHSQTLEDSEIPEYLS